MGSLSFLLPATRRSSGGVCLGAGSYEYCSFGFLTRLLAGLGCAKKSSSGRAREPDTGLTTFVLT